MKCAIPRNPFFFFTCGVVRITFLVVTEASNVLTQGLKLVYTFKYSLLWDLARFDGDKVDTFAEYFATVFTDDDKRLPDFDFNNNDHIDKFTCTAQDVIKVVRKLKTNSAPDPDNIPALFLKKILAHIANPLAKLFTVSLEEGCVPLDWRKAIAIPIFMKQDPQVASNYRPVSLTSVVCT